MSTGMKEPHQKKNDERENAGHILNSQEEATGDRRQTVDTGRALQDDIIREILMKLPPKKVAQLRCLSKACRAMIDDLNFVRRHHRLWRQNSSNNEVLFQDSDGLYSFCLDSAFDVSHHIEARPVPGGPTQNGGKLIVGSCRGIVFVSKSVFGGYAAWNPLTGQLVDIPEIQFSIPYDSYWRYDGSFCGYDKTHQDFKLVRMVGYILHNDDGQKRNQFELAVYSLKSSSWGEFQQLPFEIFSCAIDFIDGTNALHFAARVGQENRPCIAAYDLGTDAFRFLPLPHGLDRQSGIMRLFSLDGLLSFCEFPEFASDNNVWVMGKYGDEKSWRKLFCIQVRYVDFRVIGYSRNRKHVLVFDDGRMKWVEIDTQTIRDAAEILVASAPSAHLEIYKAIAFQPTLYRIR